MLILIQQKQNSSIYLWYNGKSDLMQFWSTVDYRKKMDGNSLRL